MHYFFIKSNAKKSEYIKMLLVDSQLTTCIARENYRQIIVCYGQNKKG